jgi:DNA-binding CsgD family transcriptional regulator
MQELTPREREVFKLVAAGYQTKMVAAKMQLSNKTVEKFKMNIFYKWKVSSNVAMIRVGLRHGELTLNEFLASKVDENCGHQKPQHMHQRIAYETRS